MVAVLNVPYKDKDKAKELGAKWNPDLKKWVAMHDEPELVRLWGESLQETEKPLPVNIKKLSIQLISEDRSFENTLFVDIPPRYALFEVKRELSREQWHALKNLVIGRVNSCEICGSGNANSLEVHERWRYDDKNNIRILTRLIALCADCHEATHYNLTYGKRREEIALDHFMKVTKLDRIRAEEHIEDAYALWKDRNDFKWTDDISMIRFS